MALKLYTQYPGRFDPVSTDYPQGKWRNRSSSTANDGGYLEEAHMNDIYGFFGALLRNAEIVPDGTVDTARKSQFYEALITVAQKVVTDNPIDLSEYLKKSNVVDEFGDSLTKVINQKLLTNFKNSVLTIHELYNGILVSDFGDISTISGATLALKLAIQHRKELGRGRVILDSNMSIGDGSIITTDFDNFELHIPIGVVIDVSKLRFNVPSTGRGYGGGYKNWFITGGGTLRGIENNSVFYIQACHTQGIGAIDTTFEELCISHVFDTMGCSRVRVIDCKIIGSPSDASTVTSRHYIEFLQLNALIREGAAYPDLLIPEHIDGIDTIDVVMSGCKFIPKYNEDGSIKSHPPRPIGNHSVTVAKCSKDIYVLDNLFDKVMPQWVGSGNYLMRGVISLPTADNVNILGNEIIIDNQGVAPRLAIVIMHSKSGILLDENGGNEEFIQAPTIHRDLSLNIDNTILTAENYSADSQLIRLSIDNSDSEFKAISNVSGLIKNKESQNIQSLVQYVYGETFTKLNKLKHLSKGRFLSINYENATKGSHINIDSSLIIGCELESSPIVSSATSNLSEKSNHVVSVNNCEFNNCVGIARVSDIYFSFNNNKCLRIRPVTENALHSTGLVMTGFTEGFTANGNIISFSGDKAENWISPISITGVAYTNGNNIIKEG